ncbi:uncharacterized protein [Bemisia tabaci]|uniref:uncharacterized protein n=1 Tax=Bemisia tabaci TaxID=7038 RepID=UPI0008F988CB|nr:PREDICTED: uncharacterized protein LOC109030617 [Bemisia tabaci]
MGLSRSPEAPPPPPAQPPPPSPTLCSRSCLLCVPRPKTRSNSPNRLPKAYRDEVKCSKKLLKDSKVLLYPEEGWARSAASSYWMLRPSWWKPSSCKVVEVAGTRRFKTNAKMVDSGTGHVFIVGSFKKTPEPDFKLCLTSKVSMADFNMGYCMTGSLERGTKKDNCFQTTHFAVIRRRDFEKY